jgi:radical SAM protein with 4Fe4S-binding SPASM domain
MQPNLESYNNLPEAKNVCRESLNHFHTSISCLKCPYAESCSAECNNRSHLGNVGGYYNDKK